LNTLFLNATTNQSLAAIQEIEELGHDVRVADSLTAAVRSIEGHNPDLIVIEASLEFSSSDAILYLRRAFNGDIVAFGANISSATQQFLAHVGIPTLTRPISEIVSPAASKTDARELAAAT
jgi:AmiR/NasT family two-component response regulator